jgi:ABC-type transport system involved in cytochrome bd biosynthesis fused ATPase/permease subunit
VAALDARELGARREDERGVATLLDALREAAMAKAIVRPELDGAAAACLGIAYLALRWFGPEASALGLLAVGALVAVTTPARRAGRRARESAWAAHATAGAATRTLVEAALELRAQGVEAAYGQRVIAAAAVLAAAERRALLSSAWVAILPALVGVAAWALPTHWIRSVSGSGLDLAVIGGAGVSAALGLVSTLDQWQRSAPYRTSQDALGAVDEQPAPYSPQAGASGHARIANLSVDALSVRHPEGRMATPAGLSFELREGGVALVGENGSGKSSALAALIGLIDADEGRITARDARGQELELAAIRHRCAYLPQRPYVDVGASVAEHLDLFGARPLARGACLEALRRVQVAELLEARGGSGLEEALSLPMGKLSGGERQRVLIARTIASEADLLVFDEPEAGLDERSRNRLKDILEEEARRRLVLLVAHDADVVPEGFARTPCTRGAVANEELAPASD